MIGTYQTAYADAHWAVDELFAADGDRVIARRSPQSWLRRFIAPSRDVPLAASPP